MKEYEAAFQNQPVDISEEVTKQQNHFFVGSRVREFDPETASGEIDWHSLELKVFCVRAEAAEGLVCLPEDGELHTLHLERANGGFAVHGQATSIFAELRADRPSTR